MTLAELEKAHEKDPDDLDIAARLADQYSRRKRPPRPASWPRRCWRRSPATRWRRSSRPGSCRWPATTRRRRQAIEAAAKANPDDPKLMLALGRIAMEAKDWTKAAEMFERGRKTGPASTATGCRCLIEIYTQTEDADKLIDVLREQVGNDPDDLKSRLQAGEAAVGGQEVRRGRRGRPRRDPDRRDERPRPRRRCSNGRWSGQKQGRDEARRTLREAVRERANRSDHAVPASRDARRQAALRRSLAILAPAGRNARIA